MAQVFKVSPLPQLIEYIGCFLAPIGFMVLTLLNTFYALLYLLSLFLAIEIHSFIKGYFKVFTAKERAIYPLLLFGIRVFRTYLFIVGLLINTIKKDYIGY